MKNAARFSDNDRRVLSRNTADKMGLNDAIVEKDFWVCFTLDYLFHHSPWKDSITFKGRRQPVQSLSFDQTVFVRYRPDSGLACVGVWDGRAVGGTLQHKAGCFQ